MVWRAARGERGRGGGREATPRNPLPTAASSLCSQHRRRYRTPSVLPPAPITRLGTSLPRLSVMYSSHSHPHAFLPQLPDPHPAYHSPLSPLTLLGSWHTTNTYGCANTILTQPHCFTVLLPTTPSPPIHLTLLSISTHRGLEWPRHPFVYHLSVPPDYT